MRASSLTLILALLLLAPSQSRQANNPALTGSESLQYAAEWRLVRAASVALQIKDSGGGREARLQLRSTGLVSTFYPLEDLYVAQLGKELCAASTMLTAKEGSRHRETRVTYDSQRRKANYLERDVKKNTEVLVREIDTPACVHDIVGGLYFMRTLSIPVGKSAEVPVSDGKKSVLARVEAQKRETVTTPAGKFNTVRYEAFLFNGVLFGRSGVLYVWLTDDDRRLPVQIQVRLQFYIGTITLQLEKIGS
jgi:hypothetical protein